MGVEGAFGRAGGATGEQDASGPARVVRGGSGARQRADIPRAGEESAHTQDQADTRAPAKQLAGQQRPGGTDEGAWIGLGQAASQPFQAHAGVDQDHDRAQVEQGMDQGEENRCGGHQHRHTVAWADATGAQAGGNADRFLHQAFEAPGFSHAAGGIEPGDAWLGGLGRPAEDAGQLPGHIDRLGVGRDCLWPVSHDQTPGR